MQFLSGYYNEGDNINRFSGRPRLTDGVDSTSTDLGKLLSGKMAVGATFNFNGCNTSNGSDNVARATSAVLPNVEVTGNNWYISALLDAGEFFSFRILGQTKYLNGEEAPLPDPFGGQTFPYPLDATTAGWPIFMDKDTFLECF